MSEQPARILLVEDEETHAALVCRAFESRAGEFHLTLASTLQEAEDYLKGSTPDLVITDLILPDGLGIGVLRGAGIERAFPVVVMTSYGDQKVAVQAMRAGALDYVVKSEATLADMPHTAERALREWFYIVDRRRGQEALKEAYKKIKEQQKALIEEERLKVLLQMAGATAHELNQPLMGLLGNIDLMRRNKDDPNKVAHHVSRIEEAGQRISRIVEKIQNIRHDETKPYVDTTSIINLDQEINILSVDESVDGFERINTILNDNPHITLARANNIEQGIKSLEDGRFDLVLLDHVLPDGDSFQFLRLMAEKGLEIPVVVSTEKGDELAALQAIQAGAYDYLPKSQLSQQTLSRSISNALEKSRLQREIRLAMKKMGQMATRDELTGLHNRRYFNEAIEREVARAKRYESELVLCIVDLDHFKQVNDTHGHAAGDLVLSGISSMLLECVRGSDLVCRYGGEEFAVILPNTQLEKACIVCERFRKMVAEYQFEYAGAEFHITVSVGITSYDSTSDQSPVELAEVADQALYKAKEAGRNRVVEHTEGLRWDRPKIGKILVSEGHITEEQLDKALSEQRFRLGEMLVQAGRITVKQLHQALDYQKKASNRLGEILQGLGHSTAEDISWALNRMKRKLGEIMRDNSFITDHELHRALAVQRYEPRQLQ
jgi:two-component system cell cycle response regulator